MHMSALTWCAMLVKQVAFAFNQAKAETRNFQSSEDGEFQFQVN